MPKKKIFFHAGLVIGVTMVIIFSGLNISSSLGISILPEPAHAIGSGDLDLGIFTIPTLTPTPLVVSTESTNNFAVTTECNGGHCWYNDVTANKICDTRGYDYASSYSPSTVKVTNRFCSWNVSSWSCDFSCSSCSTSIGRVICANEEVIILPPSKPAFSSSVTQGIVGISSPILTMNAVDPQGYNVRYQIDYNADGSIDQYAPTSGYISSGTNQQITLPYTDVGTYIIRVRAETQQGLLSDWSDIITIQLVLPDPPVIDEFCAL